MSICAIIIKNNCFKKAKVHTTTITLTYITYYYYNYKIIIVRQEKKVFPTCKALVTLTKKSVWSNIDAVTIETCGWLALSNYFCAIFTCVKGIIGTLELSKHLRCLLNVL